MKYKGNKDNNKEWLGLKGRGLKGGFSEIEVMMRKGRRKRRRETGFFQIPRSGDFFKSPRSGDFFKSPPVRGFFQIPPVLLLLLFLLLLPLLLINLNQTGGML